LAIRFSQMQKLIFPLLLSGYFFFVSCGPEESGSTISTDSVSIAQGQALFQNNCSGCHNFKQDGIGPDLSGVTETDSVRWLKDFIRAPKGRIESGDAHAKKLLADYHSLMPSFQALSDEEINQLISYLNTKRGPRIEKDDSLSIKNPVPEKIAASDIQAGVELIARIPASSDKQPLTRISKMDWNAVTKTWFILDQRGKLYKLIDQKPVVWLDISKWKPKFINQPGLATGFGSFTFHPDFARNGIFYTTHTEEPHAKKADFPIPDTIKQTLQWVLCEWKTPDPLSPVFSGTCRELLRIDMVSGIHGVQEIIFNPASKPHDEDYGLLYIGVGDGGAVENGFPFLTHHPNNIWGTIIRINPLGNNSANGQYGIPTQNPFAKNPNSNTIREIYAAGFRNPNRISWTRKGLMLATNIGQAHIEAIDIILKGNDYGWPIREGRFAMHPGPDMNKIYPLPADDSLFHISYPVAVYDHDEGNAIAGGYEYTGNNIPSFSGKYLFGDIPTGRLFYVNVADLKPGISAVVKEWFVALNGKRLTLRELCGQDRVDLRFARDEKGEIYLFTKPDGKIYRLTNFK
jgi:mono/diheme cytochrome c family protein